MPVLSCLLLTCRRGSLRLRTRAVRTAGAFVACAVPDGFLSAVKRFKTVTKQRAKEAAGPRSGSAVTLSPYRLGDQPNISSGIAMITSAPEAVRLFRDNIARQWDRAHKGESGARILRQILERTDAG